MINIGVTGQNGFIGYHLLNRVLTLKDEYNVIEFDKEFFSNTEKLDLFVSKCDVLVHLAGVNRSSNSDFLFEENIALTRTLVESLERTKYISQVVFSSSSHENLDSTYGKAKIICREMLSSWAERNGASFLGLIIPNVFGSFCKPYYNSFISTFCDQLINNSSPVINVDNEVSLIYIDTLISNILFCVQNKINSSKYIIMHTEKKFVSDVLIKLEHFRDLYLTRGEIPELKTEFDLNLFNTFRSFIDPREYFPVKLKENVDDRGTFVETIRLGIGGQCSYSTTKPAVTRGNHYHTRKIERFIVVQGEALIKLRKVGSDEVIEIYVKGDEPAFVDMPIWYTHNIKNIGDQELLTMFWISEVYDPANSDTFFQEV